MTYHRPNRKVHGRFLVLLWVRSYVVLEEGEQSPLFLVSQAIKASDKTLERTLSLRECFLFCSPIAPNVFDARKFKDLERERFDEDLLFHHRDLAKGV